MKQAKTILQLWKEKESDYLIVRKANWTIGYCFVVNSIHSITARGVTYRLNRFGDYELCEKNAVYRCNEALFYPVQSLPVFARQTDVVKNTTPRTEVERKVIRKAVVIKMDQNNKDQPALDPSQKYRQIVSGKVNPAQNNPAPALRTEETKKEPTITYSRKRVESLRRPSGDCVKINCAVEVRDLSTGEISRYRIVSSHDVIRYTTMGYKTKNYTEITRDSDADGHSSISDESPLGKALLQKCVGEVASYRLNGTIQRFEILQIFH